MIGERIKRARNAAGLSLRAVAEAVGLSATAVSKFETGKLVPASGGAAGSPGARWKRSSSASARNAKAERFEAAFLQRLGHSAPPFGCVGEGACRQKKCAKSS
jgi:hypothetical protein